MPFYKARAFLWDKIMKKTALALALSLFTACVQASAIFDGTTTEIDLDSENAKPTDVVNTESKAGISNSSSENGTPTVEISDGTNKVEFLNVNEYFGLNVKKDSNGKISDISIDNQKVEELFKISAPLHVGTLMAIQPTDTDKLAFVSENTRFYFVGELYDMYNGFRRIKTPDDIRQFASRVNYKTLGIDLNTLNSASIGTGKDEVAIWVSPNSPLTQEIMDQAINLAKKDMERYTFFFIVISTGDSESFDLAKRFYCGRIDGNPRVGNLLYLNQLEDLTNRNCNLSGYEKTMAVKYMSDVDLVPFVVAPDGRVSRGIPSQGLEVFLNEGMQENSKLNLDDREQLAIKKELEEKITELASENELQNELNNVDYSSISNAKNQNVLDAEAQIKRLEDIKENYRPLIQKVQDRIDGENINYERERNRIVGSQESLNNDNRMNVNLKISKLQNLQDRLNKLDSKHNAAMEKFSKEKEKLQKQMEADIENAKSEYDKTHDL